MATDGIEPDTKDWTWVLDRRCEQCGFDASSVPGRTVADALTVAVARWRVVLAQPEARRRPDPGTWSALEYGAHVRDVCRVFDERLRLMLTEDDPLFDSWDQDQTALDDGYRDQAPDRVAEELAAAAAAFAMHLAAVPDDAWSRPGRRSDGSVFTVDTLSRYFLHDVLHHLHDVGV